MGGFKIEAQVAFKIDGQPLKVCLIGLKLIATNAMKLTMFTIL